MVFEAGTWWVAFQELRNVRGKHGYFEAVRLSKDPTVFTVLFEDTAAMLGLIIAFTGILIGQLPGLPVLDGIASLVIGGVLAVTAVYLAYECKGLLTGEGASRIVVAEIERIIGEEADIVRLNELLTMHFSPNDILLNVSLDFADRLSLVEVENHVSALERRINSCAPQKWHFYTDSGQPRRAGLMSDIDIIDLDQHGIAYCCDT